MSAKIPNVIFVLGGPGAGKGTQCLKIVDSYGYVHLSAGDLLRAERKRVGSKVGEEIEMHIQKGSIVPVEITCTLLQNAMAESGKDTFLIDGFPRNKDNLDGWMKQVGPEQANVKGVLFFECSDKVCIDRCLERGKSSGRSDDNETSLAARITTYNESTMPIIKQFDEKKLVKRIDADKTEAEVFEQCKEALKNM